MTSLTPEFLDRILLNARHSRSIQALGAYQGRQDLFTRRLPQILETLKQNAVIESTESSNRIEGIVASHEAIRQLVLNLDTEATNRSEQEIAGYRDALNLIHESAADIRVGVGEIKQLHGMLYRYLPGEGGDWKNINNDIVEKNADGVITRVRFRTVPAHLTDIQMRQLVENYRQAIEAATIDPLILIPLFVLDYLCVHPFRDGNGRTARLLSLLLLYQAGYEVGRYISLERIIEESKESYYETLETSSQGWHEAAHDPLPWMTYYWGMLIKAYKEYESRVEGIKEGRGSKGQIVRQAVMRRHAPFTISEIEKECGAVSRELVRRTLQQMRDESLLLLEGWGGGAKWRRIL